MPSSSWPNGTPGTTAFSFTCNRVTSFNPGFDSGDGDTIFESDKDFNYEELVRLAKKKQAGPEGGSTYALLAVADRLNEILKVLKEQKS